MKDKLMEKILDLLEMVRRLPEEEEPKRKKREVKDGSSKIEGGGDE